MVRFKICCIAGIAEAELAIAHGASALGLVSRMPSGPGVIDDATIREVATWAPPHIETFLLTSRTDPHAIVAQVRAAGVNTVQLVDALPEGAHALLRRELSGIRLVQVIHVRDDDSVREALALGPHVDALLLDSGNPALEVKELGGTGRVHDWTLSRRIVAASGVPVWLAGGLRAENVTEAIAAVRPHGLDVCSGVREQGRLSVSRLSGFARAVRG